MPLTAPKNYFKKYPNFISLHEALNQEALHQNIKEGFEAQHPMGEISLFFHQSSNDSFGEAYSTLNKYNTATNAQLQTCYDQGEINYINNMDGVNICLIPLYFQGSAYGIAALYDCVGQGWDEDWVRDLGSAMSIALIKIQLYDQANSDSRLASEKLNALNSVAALLKNIDTHTLLAKLLNLSLSIMKAQVGNVMLLKEEGLCAEVELGLNDEVASSFKLKSGQRLIDHVLESDTGLFFDEHLLKSQLDTENMPYHVESLIAIPLSTKNQQMGVLLIINNEQGFSRDDFEVLSTVSTLASSTIENAILQEQQLETDRLKQQMNIAQSIQDSLHAQDNPTHAGLDFSGWTLACDETGGDYYDFIELKDGRMAFIVGDASGHGLPAALMMVAVRSSLLTLLEGGLPLNEIFDRVNSRIEADSDESRFMTLFCGIVDPKAKTMVYCSAGHDGPVLYSPSTDGARELDATGLPLGMFTGMPYELSPVIDLHPQDVLMLGTDGIWEARNDQDEMLGKTFVEDVLRESYTCGAEAIGQLIRTRVMDFIGGHHRHDDITAVIMSVTGDS